MLLHCFSNELKTEVVFLEIPMPYSTAAQAYMGRLLYLILFYLQILTTLKIKMRQKKLAKRDFPFSMSNLYKQCKIDHITITTLAWHSFQ